MSLGKPDHALLRRSSGTVKRLLNRRRGDGTKSALRPARAAPRGRDYSTERIYYEQLKLRRVWSGLSGAAQRPRTANMWARVKGHDKKQANVCMPSFYPGCFKRYKYSDVHSRPCLSIGSCKSADPPISDHYSKGIFTYDKFAVFRPINATRPYTVWFCIFPDFQDALRFSMSLHGQ